MDPPESFGIRKDEEGADDVYQDENEDDYDDEDDDDDNWDKADMNATEMAHTHPGTARRARFEQSIDEAIERRRRANLAAAQQQKRRSSDHNHHHHHHENGRSEDGEDHDHFDPEIWGNYEYLDHTADVQLHSWGDTLEEALEDLILAMFGYMTPLSQIELDETASSFMAGQVCASGHDLPSLVFALLQEWLSLFHETGFVARQVTVEPIDPVLWQATSSGQGERFQPDRHEPGTEIKAVTYSNLQVIEDSRWDVYVIVDI